MPESGETPPAWALGEAAERAEYLSLHPELVTTETVSRLNDLALRHIRVDPHRALRIAESCLAVAERLGDARSEAQGHRCKANALYSVGQHRAAVAEHRRAEEVYGSLGDQEEVARTLSTSIQPYLLLGEYDQALAAAQRAREIFEAAGNHWRIARLDINLGNIYHRQDRFAEALACYQRAYEAFQTHSDPEGMAAVLSNIATCQITLNDFVSAQQTYEQARAFCESHGMTQLVGQADYNIAWMHYLRGNYGRAIEMLRRTRDLCRQNQDTYHYALCHMDLSEIYLEMNLSEEAAETAKEGWGLFEQLGMGYEKAKCITNLAAAMGQSGQTFRALELFGQAREIFVSEKNSVWPSLLDLYQALLLFHEGRLVEARGLCAAAQSFFDGTTMQGKAVLCHLLMSKLHARGGDAAAALRECSQAIAKLKPLDLPMLGYQAELQMGELHLAGGRRPEAYASLESARDQLEAMRGYLRGQELKIAFVKNRLGVYEHLVGLCLTADAGSASPAKAFAFIEESKSRALVELMFHRGESVVRGDAGQSELARNLRELREELNWYYHRIEHEQLNDQERSPERIETLQKKARERETAFVQVLRELPIEESEAAGLQAPRSVPLEELRSLLPPDTVVLEYFLAGDQWLAMRITQEELEITPVTVASRINHLLRLLQFQMSKFQLGEEYVRKYSGALLQAIQGHLRQFYQELIAPLRGRLAGERLIVVPHRELHYLPFHAFHDGARYLTDAYAVSYAPSSSIYALCQKRKTVHGRQALLMGVADPRAPYMEEEIKAIAAILPGSLSLVGGEAKIETLRQQGAGAGIIHIATHGVFRHDNPLFSRIRLSDEYVSLYDLGQMKLPADLITLSGCATGLSHIAAGDELLGLLRGLFQAGARSLVLSLWNVHDSSTFELMKDFYRKLSQTGDKAAALQEAMRSVRELHPHPYYWAPFKVIGATHVISD